MRLLHVLIALAALAIAPEASAQSRWLRAESAHFIAYSRSGEAALRQDVEELERFDATLRQLTQNNAGPSENKLEIYLLRNHDDLEQVWPSVSRDVLGFYHAAPEQIAAFSTARNQGLDPRTVLFHEYAHHFMLQYFADAYPGWFTEGFAEYVSTADLNNRRSRLGGYEIGRTQPLYSLSWANLADILDPSREGARRVPSHMFYSQSWLMVHYILSSQERKRALSRYFNAVQGGADRIAAFEDAFGMSADAWQRQLRGYLTSGITLQDFPPAQADLSMQITSLPESANDLLLPMARARRPVPDDERVELAERLIAAASRYPDDAYAQYARARAELVRNQPAAARPILEAVIAANANDSEANYLMGMTYIREAEADGLEDEARLQILRRGRTYFARAFRIDPNHVPTLYYYVRTFPVPMEDSTLEVLLRAQELAPQVHEISFATATALMLAHAHAQAVPMLQAIAYDGHGGSLRRHALITLEAALRGEDPPPPPPPEEEEAED
jgi:hypothetical protein